MNIPEVEKSTLEELKQTSGADFLRELVDTFLDEAPRLLGQLHTALAAGDVETFRRAAHSLKSNGATFGAGRFSQQAKELEMLARENKLGETGPRLQDLEETFNKVAVELKDVSA